MKINVAAFAAVALGLLSVGCYNNPHISEQSPSKTEAKINMGPQVGPGTTPGGSTAGPQPAATKEKAEHSAAGEHVEGEHERATDKEHAEKGGMGGTAKSH